MRKQHLNRKENKTVGKFLFSFSHGILHCKYLFKLQKYYDRSIMALLLVSALCSKHYFENFANKFIHRHHDEQH